MDELEKDLMDEKTTATLLRVKPFTMTIWRSRYPHRSPPYVQIGRHIYYSRAQLAQWIKNKTVHPQQEDQ